MGVRGRSGSVRVDLEDAVSYVAIRRSPVLLSKTSDKWALLGSEELRDIVSRTRTLFQRRIWYRQNLIVIDILVIS